MQTPHAPQRTDHPSHEDPPPPGPGVRWRPPFATTVVKTLRRWRAPRLAAYAPRSTLELPAHHPQRAQVQAIDFHTHLGRWLTNDAGWMERDVDRLLDTMDACNVTTLVNLDGRWGRELEENLERYDRAHPGRFCTFCHLDWRLLEEENGPDLLVASLERSIAAGARGLKVWKDLGLDVTARGRRVLPDDPMLTPVWEAAGTAGIPVLIHVGDPAAFFMAKDRHNERLEEMLRNPKAVRSEGLAHLQRLFEALESIVASHPRTSFVGAHAIHPENLVHVSALLDRYPNLSIDVAAAVGQLGRQPRATRALCLRHPDRILFGTDIFPLRPSVHRIYFRLLETADEAFPYSDETQPLNGRWPIYGLDLPSPVLEKIYHGNAARLLHASDPNPTPSPCAPRPRVVPPRPSTDVPAPSLPNAPTTS